MEVEGRRDEKADKRSRKRQQFSRSPYALCLNYTGLSPPLSLLCC